MFEKVLYQDIKWNQFSFAHTGSKIADFCAKGLPVIGVRDWGVISKSFYLAAKRGGLLLPRFNPEQVRLDADGLSITFIGPKYEKDTEEGKPTVMLQREPVVILYEHVEESNGSTFGYLRPQTRTHVHRTGAAMMQELVDVYKLRQIRLEEDNPAVIFALEFPKNEYADSVKFERITWLSPS